MDFLRTCAAGAAGRCVPVLLHHARDFIGPLRRVSPERGRTPRGCGNRPAGRVVDGIHPLARSQNSKSGTRRALHRPNCRCAQHLTPKQRPHARRAHQVFQQGLPGSKAGARAVRMKRPCASRCGSRHTPPQPQVTPAKAYEAAHCVGFQPVIRAQVAQHRAPRYAPPSVEGRRLPAVRLREHLHPPGYSAATACATAQVSSAGTVIDDDVFQRRVRPAPAHSAWSRAGRRLGCGRGDEVTTGRVTNNGPRQHWRNAMPAKQWLHAPSAAMRKVQAQAAPSTPQRVQRASSAIAYGNTGRLHHRKCARTRHAPAARWKAVAGDCVEGQTYAHHLQYRHDGRSKAARSQSGSVSATARQG